MISRILVTLRCGFEVLFYVDLLLYIVLFSYVLLYFASEVNFSSQFGRLTQITRVYAMLLLLKKVIAGLERYFSSKNPLFYGSMIQNSKSDIFCCLQVLLGTDSHTCTAGAFGQFATGIGNTDAGFVLGTGKLLLKVCGCCILFHHVILISYTCHSYRFYANDVNPWL